MSPELDLTPKTQLGFFFRADNCIACHSCEAACSEKNGNPPHIAWRHVGYLEGSRYAPGCGTSDFTRLNVSMACNHCVDPVCLKGCPTGAYVKYEKYGAVIQDPDICFGCQYCTWVCPYNAPAYDPQKGSVSKCNMCVDRLDQGLKPACVDACLGHALEFGEIGKRDVEEPGWVSQIPGFPDPSITKPNVRFERKKPLPQSMVRTDSVPLSYVTSGRTQSDMGWIPQAITSRAKVESAGLSLKALKTGEMSLAIFTLLAQMVIGAFWTGFGLHLWIGGDVPKPFGLALQWVFPFLVGCLGVGMGLSTAHLGKPWRCYRALNNLRYSWLSREILTVGCTFAGLLLFTGLFSGPAWLPPNLVVVPPTVLIAFGWAVGMTGALAIFCMAKIYMVPARPYWNHPHTMVAFFTSAMNLGPLTVASSLLLVSALAGAPMSPELAVGVQAAIVVAWLALVVQRLSELKRDRDLALRNDEAAVSRELMTKVYGRWVNLRYGLSGIQLMLLPFVIVIGMVPNSPVDLLAVLSLGALTVAIPKSLVGRIIFYLFVVPTSMPGAFFLRNPGLSSLVQNHAQPPPLLVGAVQTP